MPEVEISENSSPVPATEGVQDSEHLNNPSNPDSGSTSHSNSEVPGTSSPAPAAVNDESFIDPSKLPPELMVHYKNMQAAFTKKTQEIASVRDKARAFDELVGNKDFQNWYVGLTRGEQKQVQQNLQQAPEFSDDQFQELLSDKNKFLSFINQMADSKMSQNLVPIINQTRYEMSVMKRENEINEFAASHPDFWELDNNGLIEPILMKYQGIGIQDAYRLAKVPFDEALAVQKAHGVVQNKKNSVSEKPGLSRNSVNDRVKYKDRIEAMKAAFSAAKAGHSIPDIEIG